MRACCLFPLPAKERDVQADRQRKDAVDMRQKILADLLGHPRVFQNHLTRDIAEHTAAEP